MMVYPMTEPDFYFTFAPTEPGPWDTSICSADSDGTLQCTRGGLQVVYLSDGADSSLLNAPTFDMTDGVGILQSPIILQWSEVPCTC